MNSVRVIDDISLPHQVQTIEEGQIGFFNPTGGQDKNTATIISIQEGHLKIIVGPKKRLIRLYRKWTD
jgi:hypothetical protein